MKLNVSLRLTKEDGHQIQTVETIHLGNVTERNESRTAADNSVQNDGSSYPVRPMSIHVS